MARAAGSLLGRHSYSSVCAMVFPHVVTDMLNQANSFTGDAQVSEAIERGEFVCENWQSCRSTIRLKRITRPGLKYLRTYWLL